MKTRSILFLLPLLLLLSGCGMAGTVVEELPADSVREPAQQALTTPAATHTAIPEGTPRPKAEGKGEAAAQATAEPIPEATPEPTPLPTEDPHEGWEELPYGIRIPKLPAGYDGMRQDNLRCYSMTLWEVGQETLVAYIEALPDFGFEVESIGSDSWIAEGPDGQSMEFFLDSDFSVINCYAPE